MMAEVLAGLEVRPGGRYADGTVGGGGHAAAILKASAPDGWLWACDRDGAATEGLAARLAGFAGRFEVRRGHYADLTDWIAPGSCDGVLFDLGVSSPQLDWPERGFSFQQDGPLDMRMDTRQALTAATLVNETNAGELSRIFWELGGEREARRIARAIEKARMARRIETTGQLAAVVEQVSPRRGRRAHPATRVFQALRMVVNDELAGLQRGLGAALTLLKSGGRLAVITFHSLEDRLVKEFGRREARDYAVPGAVDVPELRQPRVPTVKWVSRKAIKPSDAELTANPRARSAQLRVLEKI